ncbi:Collagen alpha-6(VI) chain [Stylophora pistillata]|uniref:Collagen alpha-6(VI) chain n=1 Tax=Stylophora pistillata TaxID=50429 RepID=A0A2B4SZC9_STYPI|nr:Collagen alpha-6(VI) chain [Stylophora pistillata]
MCYFASRLDVHKCKMDLGLIVDTTKSIRVENIPILTEALKHLVQEFEIGSDRTHVSLETFSSEATLHNKFNDEQYHSEDALLKLISDSINNLAQPTRLDKALVLAKEEMFTEESGMRPDARNAVVLYTDGRSHPDTEDFYLDIVALKMRGVRIVVVGIGPDARKPKYHQVLDYIGGSHLFFVDDYKNLDEATHVIGNLICPPDPCENSKGMDVAFVIDKTKSIGVPNFLLLKGFLLELVHGLDIGPEKTHTGVITFNRKPKVLSTFANEKLYSNKAVHDFITGISVVLGDHTFIDKALNTAAQKLFTEEGGDRPNFPNALILLTDGRSNSNSKPFSSIVPLLQEKNVHIAAIGIGEYEDFEGQLEEIAGKNVYNASNFDKLSDLFEDILAEICTVEDDIGEFKPVHPRRRVFGKQHE